MTDTGIILKEVIEDKGRVVMENEGEDLVRKFCAHCSGCLVGVDWDGEMIQSRRHEIDPYVSMS